MFFLKRVIAGRAAVQTTNERSLMQEAAVTLYQRFLSENKLAEKNIISLHFRFNRCKSCNFITLRWLSFGHSAFLQR